MATRNPVGLCAASMRAAPPNTMANRLRTFSSPTPLRARGTASGSRGFSTAIARRSPVAHDVEPDGAAVDQAGNAVPDGVFEQRLQHQRRHLALQRALVDRPLDLQARPESYLFDAEKPIRQRQLLGQRNPLLRAHAQRRPKELGQQQAHAPRRRRVAARERADRVEAVVQEVRVDLRAQGAQLGVAGQDLQFELLALRGAERFEGEHHVVHRQHQQEEHHADGEQEGHLAAEPRGDRRRLRASTRACRARSRSATSHSTPPTVAATRRGREHPRHAAGRQRHGPADVPGRQADEGVDEQRRERPGRALRAMTAPAGSARR